MAHKCRWTNKIFKKGLTISPTDAIIIIEREGQKSMNECLLKELLNRIEMCQSNEIDTCDCVECPLYKEFGDRQNICLKLLEIKKVVDKLINK